MADLGQLSSFIGNHSQHDPKWTIPGSQPHSIFCLACAVESFEDPNSEVPMVKKKHLLGELLNAVNLQEELLLDLLTDDFCVASHLTQTVYSLLEESDETLSAVVIEVLVQLCCSLKSEDLVCCLVCQISKQVQQACSFSTSLPALTLLGRLLQSIPALVQMVNQNEESLIAYVMTGLSYPDEKVKSACAFTLAHAVTSPTEGSRQVSLPQVGQLASSLLPLLATAQSKELRVNAMGLLKKLLEQEESTRILMQYQGKTSLASIIKRMLLSRDDTLQVTGVQCTAQVLLHQRALPSHCQYAEELLNGDLAEFLYEVLATTNGLLLSSTFCCLLLFTEIDSFFSKCHSVYGIESIVRAVQQSAKLNNTEALNHGLQLLSEIFKKQPADIHLMNNDTTLTQLCSLLTDCMAHTEITTVIHTTQTLANLLRRDHLPSPIPFQPLIATLQSVLDSLQRLPKPLVDSGHRSHSSKSSHHRHARPEGLGRAHCKQELLLARGLQAVLQAFRLAAACLHDPSTTESQFTAPASQTPNTKTQGSGLDSLVQLLLQALDGTCIPLVMVNIDNISLPEIFTSLFSMLCVAMEFDLLDINKFSIKLASSSFIQFALIVKNKFPTQDRQLQEAANSFLSNLCACLQHPCSSAEQQALKDMLQEALPLIHGSPNEMLNLLYELPQSANCASSSAGQDDMDRVLHLKQQACLALLYYAFLHADRLAAESAVNEAVLSFLSNHPNLKKLSTSISKHLLLLLATSHGNGTEQSTHPGVQSFLRVLEEGDMSSIYTHHPCLIDWCFGSGCQRSDFAQRILEKWLLHSSSEESLDRGSPWDQGDKKKTFSRLLRMNQQCFDMILDIMSSGSDQLVHEALSLLESVLSDASSSADDSMQMMLLTLRRRLPDMVQRIFLSEEKLPADIHVLALLQLVCTVHRRCPVTELEGVDVKLMYHVTNLISKTSGSNPDMLQASLNYLTTLLIQTAACGETRVVSMLLSNVSTLRLLEGLLSPSNPSQLPSVHCCCLSILAQIVTCQAKFNVKVPYTMTLDLSLALEFLCGNRHILRKVCGLQLWTAIFDSKFESPVLKLDKTSMPRALMEDEDVGLGIQAKSIRSIYARVQNSIAQSDPLLSQAAVTCLRSMIRYVLEKSQGLAKHLLAQPWNHQLMNYCIESGLDSGSIPSCVIQLITLFLQHGNKENVVRVQHLEGVADYLRSMDVSHCQRQQVISDALLFTQQVIVQPDVKLTPKVVQGLYAFLLQVTELANYQSLRRQDDVVLVRGVMLQHPESFSSDHRMSHQGEKMASLAKDLLGKLAKYQE